jgi:hypothetical protein
MVMAKLELSEEQFFRLAKTANDNNMTVAQHIESMQSAFTNIHQTFEEFSQLEIENFKNTLFNTISEILDSQEELARSDDGTIDDKIMVDVLNILFGRATRDRLIFSEMCNKYYELLRK